MDITETIHKARSQHGLRHMDYGAYHAYCSNRLMRLRRRGVHGMEEALFEAERAYAYAEMLKPAVAHKPRAKFQITKRLRRAVQHSANLLKECGEDSRLQCQVYHHWMAATEAVHLKNWEESKKHLVSATVCLGNYEERSTSSKEAVQAVFSHPVQQLTRYVAHITRSSLDDQIRELKLDQVSTSKGAQEMWSPKTDQLFSAPITLPCGMDKINDSTQGQAQILDLLSSNFDTTKETLEKCLSLVKSDAKIWREAIKSYKGASGPLLWLQLKSVQSKLLSLTIQTWATEAIDLTRISRKLLWKLAALFKQIKACLIKMQGILGDHATLAAKKAMQLRIDLCQVDILWAEALGLYRQGHAAKAAQCIIQDQRSVSILSDQSGSLERDLQIYSAAFQQMGVSVPLEVDARLRRARSMVSRLAIYLMQTEKLVSLSEADAMLPSLLALDPWRQNHLPGFLRQQLSEDMSMVHVKPIFYDLAYDYLQYEMPETTAASNSSSSNITGLLKRWWGSSPSPS